MISIAVGILFLGQKVAPKPVLAFQLDGTVVSPTPVTWRPGSKVIPVPRGVGIEFKGSSGWMVPDDPKLVLTKALTISAWIKPEDYVTSGPGAQILFRGDDRNGLDPYQMTITPTGKVAFGIQNDKGKSMTLDCDVPLHLWTHVVGSFDSKIGELRLYVNGKLMDTLLTSIFPIGFLEAKSAPGVGVGNIQWDKGPHNQPYHGVLADVRLYNVALTPKDVQFHPEGWNDPF